MDDAMVASTFIAIYSTSARLYILYNIITVFPSFLVGTRIAQRVLLEINLHIKPPFLFFLLSSAAPLPRTRTRT
jgi:hypothetical protein